MFNNKFRHKTVTNTILRYEAEALLEGRPEGSFLLRDSAQDEYLFSVSFRRYSSISSLRHITYLRVGGQGGGFDCVQWLCLVLAAIPHNFSFAQLELTQPYLCITRYGRSLHARIEEQNHKFSFDCHDPGVFMSANIPSLMEHYKDPASCMFFEPMLCQAVNRKSPFSLQFLARATICDTLKSYSTVDQLELPKSLKAYLKEYHYRHKVRVRRLDLEGAT